MFRRVADACVDHRSADRHVTENENEATWVERACRLETMADDGWRSESSPSVRSLGELTSAVAHGLGTTHDEWVGVESKRACSWLVERRVFQAGSMASAAVQSVGNSSTLDCPSPGRACATFLVSI